MKIFFLIFLSLFQQGTQAASPGISSLHQERPPTHEINQSVRLGESVRPSVQTAKQFKQDEKQQEQDFLLRAEEEELSKSQETAVLARHEQDQESEKSQEPQELASDGEYAPLDSGEEGEKRRRKLGKKKTPGHFRQTTSKWAEKRKTLRENFLNDWSIEQTKAFYLSYLKDPDLPFEQRITESKATEGESDVLSAMDEIWSAIPKGQQSSVRNAGDLPGQGYVGYGRSFVSKNQEFLERYFGKELKALLDRLALKPVRTGKYLKHLKPSKEVFVADIGAGFGFATFFLARALYSQFLIQNILKNSPKIHFQLIEVNQEVLPALEALANLMNEAYQGCMTFSVMTRDITQVLSEQRPEQYDFILFFNVLHALSESSWSTVMKTLSSVLRQEGVLLVTANHCFSEQTKGAQKLGMPKESKALWKYYYRLIPTASGAARKLGPLSLHHYSGESLLNPAQLNRPNRTYSLDQVDLGRVTQALKAHPLEAHMNGWNNAFFQQKVGHMSSPQNEVVEHILEAMHRREYQLYFQSYLFDDASLTEVIQRHSLGVLTAISLPKKEELQEASQAVAVFTKQKMTSPESLLGDSPSTALEAPPFSLPSPGAGFPMVEVPSHTERVEAIPDLRFLERFSVTQLKAFFLTYLDPSSSSSALAEKRQKATQTMTSTAEDALDALSTIKDALSALERLPSRFEQRLCRNSLGEIPIKKVFEKEIQRVIDSVTVKKEGKAIGSLSRDLSFLHLSFETDFGSTALWYIEILQNLMNQRLLLNQHRIQFDWLSLDAPSFPALSTLAKLMNQVYAEYLVIKVHFLPKTQIAPHFLERLSGYDLVFLLDAGKILPKKRLESLQKVSSQIFQGGSGIVLMNQQVSWFQEQLAQGFFFEERPVSEGPYFIFLLGHPFFQPPRHGPLPQDLFQANLKALTPCQLKELYVLLVAPVNHTLASLSLEEKIKKVITKKGNQEEDLEEHPINLLEELLSVNRISQISPNLGFFKHREFSLSGYLGAPLLNDLKSTFLSKKKVFVRDVSFAHVGRDAGVTALWWMQKWHAWMQAEQMVWLSSCDPEKSHKIHLDLMDLDPKKRMALEVLAQLMNQAYGDWLVVRVKLFQQPPFPFSSESGHYEAIFCFDLYQKVSDGFSLFKQLHPMLSTAGKVVITAHAEKGEDFASALGFYAQGFQYRPFKAKRSSHQVLVFEKSKSEARPLVLESSSLPRSLF